MLDIKFIRENPDAVKENIRKKFQNAKLPLVDEVIALEPRSEPPRTRAMICGPSATSSPSRWGC